MTIDKQNPMLSSSEKAALKKLKHKENVANQSNRFMAKNAVIF